MKKQIYTDNKKAINTDLLYADLTYRIRGVVFTVYNELGYGHKENVYQQALIHELEEKNISFKKEISLKVKYKSVVVGNYRPDLIIDDRVILELKAVEFLPKSFKSQLLNYLKTTGFELGMLINFGTPKLYIKRLINSYPRKSENISENSVSRKAGQKGGEVLCQQLLSL